MEQRYAGYWGRILRINLTNRATEVIELSPLIYRKYMGGRNLALHFLLHEVSPNADALGPENKLVFMTSIATGSAIAGQGRHTAAAISPLTGGLADSQCGGWWGAELKFAGWDGIIVEGQSSTPVYITIEDDAVGFHSASHLWGKETGEVFIALHEAHGHKSRILQAGPAGENLVKYAGNTADLRHFHGRGGLGAVMGSKKLRAIVVRGTNRKLRIADPQGLSEIARWFANSTKNHPAISVHHELGSPKGVVPLSVQGILPTYNFQDGSFDAAEQVSGEAMHEVLDGKSESCYACAVACKRSVEGQTSKFKVTREYGGPEYESLGLLGPNLAVDDITAIAQSNELCNALGLDTISTGVTLSWAIECFERGLITLSDTSGLELKWNDPETYHQLIRMIARREGFGTVLAEGSKRAAEAIGRGTLQYAMQVKGQELPAHEPRGKWGVALGYAVSPTGADHLQAAHDPWFDKPGEYTTDANWVDLEDLSPLGIVEPVPTEDLSGAKVRLFVYLQYIWALHDVLNWCIFTTVPEFRAIDLNKVVAIVQAITGWRTSLFELTKVGERAITLARVFNVQRGFSADDDQIPERFFEPLRAGTLAGHAIDRAAFDKALIMYYGMLGWSERGVPTEAKLEELNLNWAWELVQAAEKRG